jgi:hypothetical protein
MWAVIPPSAPICNAVAGALTNLNIALCGGTEETNDVYSAGFCQLGALKFIITSTFFAICLQNALTVYRSTRTRQ